MRKRIAVLLGAGASHDVGIDALPVERPDWKPPLARDLFRFQEHSNYYEIALRYGDPLRLILPKLADQARRDVFDLEGTLRAHADHRDAAMQRAFKRIPPYLCDVLRAVTANHVRVPGAYVEMIRRFTSESAHDVAFVSLNYDCLLEKALRSVDWRATSIDHYIANAQILVVKPHGSANWLCRLDGGEGDWDSDVDRLDLRELRQREIVIDNDCLDGVSHQIFRGNHPGLGNRHYPLLTAPLAGKDQSHIVCPPAHVEHLHAFLADCSKLIVAGTSALDTHVLRLINDGLQRLDVVSVVGTTDLDVITARLFGSIPKAIPARRIPYAGGFQRYVMESEEFSEVLRH